MTKIVVGLIGLNLALLGRVLTARLHGRGLVLGLGLVSALAIGDVVLVSRIRQRTNRIR